MNMNIFKIKRIVSYYIPPLFSVFVFVILLLSGLNFIFSIILSLLTSFALSYLMYRWTKHPILSTIEGEGIWVLVIDSKGVIKSYVAKIKVEGDTVKLILPNEKELLFKREELTYILFGSDIALPVLIYNEVLGVPLTKEDLMNKEKMYLEHIDLEILHKVSELSKYMRDFARYIIEQMKPRKISLGNLKWIIIIMTFILIIGAIIYFAGGGFNVVQTTQVANITTIP